jgi:hypothetical protein
VRRAEVPAFVAANPMSPMPRLSWWITVLRWITRTIVRAINR